MRGTNPFRTNAAATATPAKLISPTTPMRRGGASCAMAAAPSPPCSSFASVRGSDAGEVGSAAGSLLSTLLLFRKRAGEGVVAGVVEMVVVAVVFGASGTFGAGTSGGLGAGTGGGKFGLINFGGGVIVGWPGGNAGGGGAVVEGVVAGGSSFLTKSAVLVAVSKTYIWTLKTSGRPETLNSIASLSFGSLPLMSAIFAPNVIVRSTPSFKRTNTRAFGLSKPRSFSATSSA